MLIHSCITKYCQHVDLNIDNVVAFNNSKSLTGGDKDVVMYVYISMYVSTAGEKLMDIEVVDHSFETTDYIRRHEHTRSGKVVGFMFYKSPVHMLW